jgi:branched-chain amino acid aminotransferase
MSGEPEFISMTNVNGVIRDTTNAHVSVMDRGFLYGDSIYEVFRTYEGVPLFFDEHWVRFERSAALIHLSVGLSKAQMLAEIKETVDATRAAKSRRDVYVRYIATRGEGALDLYPDPKLTTGYVIIVREVPRWNPDYYERGVSVAVAHTKRNPSESLDPNIKGGNYLNNVLGVIEARALGADDCIMLNDAGLVTEASNSNVFFVIDDKLVTPSQRAANLRGLTKAAVHEACSAHHLASDEIDIPLKDVYRATECFLTSATREVMPVHSLKIDAETTLEFPAGGGDVTRRVARYYREHLQAHIEAHRALALF